MPICIGCSKEFLYDTSGKWNAKKKFCNMPCRQKHNMKKYRTRNVSLNLSSAVVGTIHELRVCLDLLKEGYEVFKNITPNGIDLAVLKDGILIKVEVTTAYYTHTGKLVNAKTHKIKKWDCLALVITNGEIIYEPDIKKKNEQEIKNEC